MHLVYTYIKNDINSEMLQLFINSLYIKSDINTNTDINVLIISNNPAIIDTYFPFNVSYHIDTNAHENYVSAVFDYPTISLYNKILYINPQSLIIQDISVLFNISINNDVVYNISKLMLFSNNPIFIEQHNIRYSEELLQEWHKCISYHENIGAMKKHWQSMNKIPTVLFQTNKTPHPDYALDMLRNQIWFDWDYKFYDDAAVINFFKENPHRDFPDISLKYLSFRLGAHRADLFRYYYLYLFGGFFMDFDAMIYRNINLIIRDYNFVSVNSSCHPGTIFQGILGASPKNEIIKRALINAYNTYPDVLHGEYHYFCRTLYNIIKENDFGYNNIKLYEERRLNNYDGDDIFINENGAEVLLFKHYWYFKEIPPRIKTSSNHFNHTQINLFDYNILSVYHKLTIYYLIIIYCQFMILLPN